MQQQQQQQQHLHSPTSPQHHPAAAAAAATALPLPPPAPPPQEDTTPTQGNTLQVLPDDLVGEVWQHVGPAADRLAFYRATRIVRESPAVCAQLSDCRIEVAPDSTAAALEALAAWPARATMRHLHLVDKDGGASAAEMEEVLRRGKELPNQPLASVVSATLQVRMSFLAQACCSQLAPASIVASAASCSLTLSSNC